MDFYFIFHFYLERQEYEKTKRAFNCIVVNYEINSIDLIDWFDFIPSLRKYFTMNILLRIIFQTNWQSWIVKKLIFFLNTAKIV